MSTHNMFSRSKKNTVFDQLPRCALRFFKITGKTCGKVCICMYLLRVHFKKDQLSTYLMMFR